MRPESPRLIDIAERVELSVTSVSRILRGHRLNEYPEATRTRVHAVAEELGWRPNLIVRGMKTGKTNTIGVFIAPFDTFWTGVLYGVHDELLDHKQVPLVLWPKALVHPTMAPRPGDADFSITAPAADDLEGAGQVSSGTNARPDGRDDPSPLGRRELDRLHYLEDRRVDAIISWPLQEADARERLAMLSGRGWRTVIVDDELPPPARATFVGIDEAAAMREVVGHLRDLGHRHIGLVETARDVAWMRRRQAAFAKVAGPRQPVLRVDVASEDLAGATVAFGREHPEVTALVAVTDHVARQVVRALLEAGVEVPRQVSVVGYGNDLYGSGDLPLTTVDQSPYAIGQAAARVALGELEPDGGEVLLQGRVVARASTAHASTVKPAT